MDLLDAPTILDCTCRQNMNPHEMCAGEFRLDDRGVKIELVPKNEESGQLIIMDGCHCSNSGKKCDALYLLLRNQGQYMLSVELKGTHVEDGVEQLAATRKREEYRNIKKEFTQAHTRKTLEERAFLVSYVPVGSSNKVKLTKEWGISFVDIVTSKGTGKLQNLRDYL